MQLSIVVAPFYKKKSIWGKEKGGIFVELMKCLTNFLTIFVNTFVVYFHQPTGALHTIGWSKVERGEHNTTQLPLYKYFTIIKAIAKFLDSGL